MGGGHVGQKASIHCPVIVAQSVAIQDVLWDTYIAHVDIAMTINFRYIVQPYS